MSLLDGPAIPTLSAIGGSIIGALSAGLWPLVMARRRTALGTRRRLKAALSDPRRRSVIAFALRNRPQSREFQTRLREVEVNRMIATSW